jgi:hypothetical protein
MNIDWTETALLAAFVAGAFGLATELVKAVIGGIAALMQEGRKRQRLKSRMACS